MSSLCPPTGGGSYSPGRGEELTRWQHFQAKARCGTLNKSGSHSASEIVMLVTKLSRFMVLFSLGNTLVYEVLPTGSEEGLPIRIWEKGRRKAQGNGKKWGGLENRKTVCRDVSCYKLLCPKGAWETCLNGIEEERVVCAACLCMSLAGETLWPSGRLPFSTGHRKSTNTPVVFHSLEGLSSVQRGVWLPSLGVTDQMISLWMN